MAKQYGGKFSPNTSHDDNIADVMPYQNSKAKKAGARSNLLFIAPAPLLGHIWGVSSFDFTLTTLGGATLVLAAWLTREGISAQESYDARTIARRPAIPRKIFASICIAIGLSLVAFSNAGIAGVVPAIACMGLHLFSFGLDPLTNKGFDSIDTFQHHRVTAAVEEAEKSLSAMEASIADLRDCQIEARINKFTRRARTLFRRVEEDPQDLTSARKYLSVYLTGAKDATEKFSVLYKHKRDPKIRADFEDFLDDLENNFAAKTDTLLDNNKVDLEIEMKVLRDRLSREGLLLDK